MPTSNDPDKFQCQYFVWPIYQRPSGVWYADGRSNGACIKRTSLGTKDHSEAITNLHQLDRIQAENIGLIQRSTAPTPHHRISIIEGRKKFDAHVSRPRIVGGTKKSTQKRYRAILDKFVAFAPTKNVHNWSQVTDQTLTDYASHLTNQGYARKTVYGELNLLKVVFKWLCSEGHLAREPLKLKLRTAECQRAYCYSLAEVAAILKQCKEVPELAWLHAVVTALACTGLRINELASLKWSDIRFNDGTLTIADESGFVEQNTDRRSTKSSKSRQIPMRRELLSILRSLPQTKVYVFHGPRSGRLKPDTVRNILVRDVIEKLKSQFPKKYPGERSFEDGRLHSFRHYFCSVCANTGIPERIVMEWLGHADSEMVRHYYHLNDQESRQKMDLLNPLGD